MPDKPTYAELENRIKQLESERFHHEQVKIKLKRHLQFAVVPKKRTMC